MRVLMVSSLWPPEVLGGAEQYAAALSARLEAAGHTVGVVTLGVDGDNVVEQVRAWPYPLREYETQSASRRALFHAADLIRPDIGRVFDRAFLEFRPDVVHSHVVQGMSAAAMTVPGARGIGHVHTIHDYWLLCQRNSLVRRDGTACDRRCRSCRVMSNIRNRQIDRRPPDVVVAVSEAIARVHLAELAWMRGRTRVVYNPVDEPRVPGPRRLADAPITFGYFGRLAADKGILTLLRAFGRAELGAARLLVAGRGPEEAAVRATPGVEYRGWVDADAKEAMYRELDCLIVPSQWPDPAPLVVNEARSRGVPVIGSTAGGIPELIDPAGEALLVAPNDIDALAASMARFVAAPDTFGVRAESRPLGWSGHLAAIERAYLDAQAGAAR